MAAATIFPRQSAIARSIAFFSVIYVVTTFMLWGLTPDGSALILMLVIFYAGFFAAESTLNFVNAILPSLGNEKEIGRISGSGAALGYWGGVVSLFIMLLLFSYIHFSIQELLLSVVQLLLALIQFHLA